MLRRTLIPAVAALAVAAVLASAQDSSPYKLPEPAVTAQATLRLPLLNRCVRGNDVRVTVLPPAGVTFTSLSVRAGTTDVLQLAGLSGVASVRVVLPRGRTRVRVTATTSGAQFVRRGRTYRRCAGSKRRAARRPAAPAPTTPAKPRPQPGAPGGVQGGGED